MITKANLVDKYAEALAVKTETKVTKKYAAAALEALREVIDEAVKNADSIKITGLGSLSVVDVPEREARNPQSGETFISPAHKDVKVKLSKTFRNLPNA